MACKGDRRGNRGQQTAPAAGERRRGDALQRTVRVRGAMTTPSGDRREKQGITSRKDRCGTEARGVIRCGCYQGSRRPLESVVRPDSFVRHGRREPKRRRRARRRPGMGRGSGFATERCHCQLFRGFRAGPRDAFDAACTGPFRFGMRQTSLAIHRACIVRLRPGRDDPASGASRSWGYARMKTRHPRSYTHRAIRRG